MRKIGLLILIPVALMYSCGTEEGSHSSGDPSEYEDIFLTATDTIVTFERPSLEAKEWDKLTPNDGVIIVGKTTDGWLGYNPKLNPGENLSALHTRWIAPGGNYNLSGNTADIPEVWSPEIDVVYAITLVETALQELPKANSDRLQSLPAGTIAGITRLDGDWFEIDLAKGNSGSTLTGYLIAVDCEFAGDIGLLQQQEDE